MAVVVKDSLETIRAALRSYGEASEVGFDIETTGLKPHHDEIAMLILKAAGKKTIVIDTRHLSPKEMAGLGELLQPYVNRWVLVGHNLKFDAGFVGVHLGLELRKVYDTQIAEYTILGMGSSEVANRGWSMKLDGLAERYGIEVSKETRPWFYDPAPLNERPEWDEPYPDFVLEYAEQDGKTPLLIKALQQEKAAKLKLEEALDLEMGVVPAVAVMTTNGQYIDTKGWMKVVHEAERVAGELGPYLHTGDITPDTDPEDMGRCVSDPECFEGFDYHILAVRAERMRPYLQWKADKEADLKRSKEAWDEGKYEGKGFKNWSELKSQIIHEWNDKQPKKYDYKSPPNMGSSEQLLSALQHMGVRVRDTKSETLERIEGEYSVLSKILDYRQAQKLPTTYGEKLMEKRDVLTGRFYPEWEQYGASTGRFSSRNYNAQNFPGRGRFAKIKRNVRAPKGWRLVTADFSNIELRILAEYTYRMFGKSRLRDAFASGEDVHTQTARMMFGLGRDVNVKSKAVINGKTLIWSWRDIAKKINYGLTYGMGAARLAIQLKVDTEVAKGFLKQYKALYVNEIAFLDSLKKQVDRAVESGQKRIKSRTMSGRIRYFDLPTPPVLAGRSREAVQQYQQEMEEYKKSVWDVKLAFANAPIQGTSADITKLAAKMLYERLGFHKHIKMVGIIHDEFMLECSMECSPEGEPWVWVGERILEEVMQAAAKHYLRGVDVGETEVVHSHYWTHESFPYMKNDVWKAWWRDGIEIK